MKSEFQSMPDTFRPTELLKAVRAGKGDDYRPVWATQGPRHEQWNSLSRDERRTAVLLLYGRRWSDLAPELNLGAGQVGDLIGSCVQKLGFSTPAEMHEYHVTLGFRTRSKPAPKKRQP